MSARPEKHPNLKALIAKCIADGNYYDTRHATDRKNERSITRLEVIQILTKGHHEKKKDEFKSEFNAWNYAIRGKTLDSRDLRIVVSFDEAIKLLIITTIEILKKGK
jgi:hypothetical protein